MTLYGAFKISLLAQRRQIFVAPLLFSWILIIHHIIGEAVSPITMLLVGCVITVYQQFSSHFEDVHDGFFDHCRFNGMHLFSYIWAKSLSVLVATLLPMAATLLIFGTGIIASFLLCFQWIILSICISNMLVFVSRSNSLNLLLAWLPLLTAPIIFLVDFLNTMQKNSLLIFIGCDIILLSTVFVPFTFYKNSSVKNVFFSP